MAESKTQSAKAETKADEKAADEPQTYPKERLIAESDEFLGQPSYVAAGALDGEKQNLTIDEAEKAVNDFLSAEVTVPPEDEE